VKLRTFDEFRSSAELLKALETIPPTKRQRFLTDAYKLAKSKHERELWLERADNDANSARTSAMRKLRGAKHIWNALNDIEKAKKAAQPDSPTLMRHLQVLEAYDLLRGAYDDLGFLIGMDIASIHPDFRTNFEKLFRATFPHTVLDGFEKKFSGMPVRQARIDYLFAASINSLLENLTTTKGGPIRPVVRHRIISKIFQAAFGELYPEGTVKTAILRAG
jgi:hypothetical protein